MVGGAHAPPLSVRVTAPLLSMALVFLLASVGCAQSDDPSTSGEETEAAAEVTAPSAGALVLPEGTSEWVVGTGEYAVPELDMPPMGGTVVEPVFGTPMTRLTDVAGGEYEGPGIQNEYSRVDPENADASLAVLRGNEGYWYLLDLATGDLSSLDDAFAECGQEPEPRWDDEDPHALHFVCGTELRVLDVADGGSMLLHDFASDIPDAAYVRTRSEGSPSLDRRYWAFTADDEDGEALAVLAYDAEADQVIGALDDLPDAIDWVGMDASGEHVLVGWDSLPYLEVFSRDLSERRRLADGTNAHGDRAVSADGRDLWVYQDTSTDFISVADLATGDVTRLLAIPFGVNADIGLHVSGAAAEAPGWALVSTYGARQPAGDEHSWMDNQLFMLELTEEPRVWRLAHTRCYTAEEADEDPMYFAECFAAVNGEGTRIYFGSNWGDLSPDYTDAFMLSLPQDWRAAVPD
jgi:hypothetical protein